MNVRGRSIVFNMPLGEIPILGRWAILSEDWKSLYTVVYTRAYTATVYHMLGQEAEECGCKLRFIRSVCSVRYCSIFG
jgi:hypothetical protein